MEEIVVVRFEGLGTFAVPVTDLDGYRVAAQSEVPDPGASDVAGELGAVPVILGEDAPLRPWGPTARWPRPSPASPTTPNAEARR